VRFPADGLVDLTDLGACRARRPLLIAHRGGVIGPGAPENSLAAIRWAATQGFDMVEVDVYASADSQPVLFHGDWSGTLKASCGLDTPVHELTLDELRAIRYRATDEHIAGLDEALALCAELRLGIMLEFKTEPAPDEMLARVVALLDAHGMTRAAVTISCDAGVRAALAGRALLRVQPEDAGRAADLASRALAGQFWFDLPADLPDGHVEPLQRAGALVLPAINTFRYPPHAHRELAAADAVRLQAASVDGFQIDAEYRDLFAS